MLTFGIRAVAAIIPTSYKTGVTSIRFMKVMKNIGGVNSINPIGHILAIICSNDNAK